MLTYQEDSEIYLTVNEACQQLGGISRQALNGYVRRGDLTKYRRTLARRIFFKQSEVNKLLELHPEKHLRHE